MESTNSTSHDVKRYETDVRSDDGCIDVPNKAKFCISEQDAQEIVRLSSLVIENGLYKVEMFDNKTSWLQRKDSDEFIEANTELDTLHIASSMFWFSAYLKHSEVQILSQRQSIKELAEWFDIASSKTKED